MSSLKPAIKRICNILEHPEYEKITTSLARFDIDGRCIGKCALGEISCKVGLKLTVDNYNIPYGDILAAAGIPMWLISGRNLPNMERLHKNVIIDTDVYNSDLEQYIWMMNDEDYTYDQIAEFLRCTFLQ